MNPGFPLNEMQICLQMQQNNCPLVAQAVINMQRLRLQLKRQTEQVEEVKFQSALRWKVTKYKYSFKVLVLFGHLSTSIPPHLRVTCGHLYSTRFIQLKLLAN